MALFWKATAGILVTVVLALCLARQERTMGLLLILGVSCMTAMVAVSFLEPVLSFWEALCQTAQLEDLPLEVLMKVVGISLVSRITVQICGDAGHSALGQALETLSGAVVLWLSLPVLETLLELIREIMEGV